MKTVSDRHPFSAYRPKSIALPPTVGVAAIDRSAAKQFVLTKAVIPGAAFAPMTGELFPRDPTRDDVKQGKLADRGLLAILAGSSPPSPGSSRG